jgi:hypothetical protein
MSTIQCKSQGWTGEQILTTYKTTKSSLCRQYSKRCQITIISYYKMFCAASNLMVDLTPSTVNFLLRILFPSWALPHAWYNTLLVRSHFTYYCLIPTYLSVFYKVRSIRSGEWGENGQVARVSGMLTKLMFDAGAPKLALQGNLW